jgi:hypothetical protein
MAVETSTVRILVTVTDANSAETIATIESNLTRMGAAGSRSGAQVKKSFEEMGAGALSAREKTRLFTEEFGIHIPRALQTLIANSAAARSALNAVGTAMIGIGMIQIGGMVFGALIAGAEKLWHNVLNVNQALEDYNAEIAKAKLEDFGNSRSIETTKLRIDDATAAVKMYGAEGDRLREKAREWSMVAPIPAAFYGWWAHNSQENQMNAQRKLDKLQKDRLPEQKHQEQIDAIELEHAYDWRLDKERKITEERRKQHEINAEDARFLAQTEGRYGNPVGTASGSSGSPTGKLMSFLRTGSGTPQSSTEGTKDAIADAKAARELAGLGSAGTSGARDARSQEEEIARLHEEAFEASLRGSELYHAKEAWAIKDLELRGIKSAAAVDDVHKRFHEEELKRLEAQRLETEHIERQAAMIGMTGAARTQAEGADRVAGIQAEDIDPALKARRIAAAQSETQTQVTEEQKRSADELAEKHQRAEEETEKLEAQARIKLMDSEKQKTAAIGIELNERLTRYREELAAQNISQDQFNRQSLAAQQLANAEMIEASTEARKKMAGEFDSLFKGLEHPGRYFEEQGNKALGEMAARLTQRIQQRHGGAGSAEPEAQGGLAGIIGQVFGAKKPGAADSTHSVAQGAFSVASAIIHVGSASIVGGAGFGGGSGGSGGGSGSGGGYSGGGRWSSSGGSTSLLDMASGVSSGPGETSSPQSFNLGSAGSVPPPNGLLDRAGAVANTASQGFGFAKNMAGFFAGGKGDDSGAARSGGGLLPSEIKAWNKASPAERQNMLTTNTRWGDSGGATGATTAGKTADEQAQGMIGAAGAGLSLFQTSQGKGGGIMAGAESGAQIGMEFGGPIGAGIGAAIGIGLGIKGDREKARIYDLQQVRPKLASDRDAYQQGGMDYTTAYSDAQGMIGTSWAATKAMGKVAEMYWGSNIKPEIEQAMAKLTAEERAGRSQYTAQAASYAVGTDYVPGTGMAMLHAGERVVPSDQNERITQAVEGAGRMPVQPADGGWQGDIHVHAIDAKGVSAFFDKYKHVMRGSFNDSYAENSGGGL